MPFDGTTQQSDDLRIISAMEVLLATPDKWCQKLYDSHHGSFCLYGAFYLAHDRLMPCHQQPQQAVGQAMNDEANARGFSSIKFNAVVAFNDAQLTTHADILDFLRAVRRRLEAAV